MGMPVKLSDELVRKARKEAARSRRSITAQVEYWASLGRMAEKSIPAVVVENLRRRGPATRPTRATGAGSSRCTATGGAFAARGT